MRRRLPHCRRRPLPYGLKVEIILRQNACCADCRIPLTPGSFVFDHRPPLALRDADDDPNDPERLAAICKSCDKHKTAADLREIARVKRRGFTYNQLLERERIRVAGRGAPAADLQRPDAPYLTTGLGAHTGRARAPVSRERVVREAEEQWDREARGLGSWPPFSKYDLT